MFIPTVFVLMCVYSWEYILMTKKQSKKVVIENLLKNFLIIFKNCVITSGAIKSVVEWMHHWWSDSVSGVDLLS